MRKAYSVELISQHQFLNSMYKESMLTFKGKSQFKDKAGLFQQRSVLQFKGVIFGSTLQKVCDKIRKLTTDQSPHKKKTGAIVEIKSTSEAHSEYLSYKKTLNFIRFDLSEKTYSVKH